MEISVGEVIFVSGLPVPDRNVSPVAESSAGSINCWTVYATSSAENGVPSENDTPLCSLNVICLLSFEIFHDVASPGSTTCVWRFKRTSTPPVRYRMAIEASSSTFRGSKVLGSERRQKRNWPCASAPPVSAARQNAATAIAFPNLTNSDWQHL